MPLDRGVNTNSRRKNKRSSIGKNHLLAIGIDAYEHCQVLKNAVKDATDMASVLEKNYGFLPEHITLVTDKEATEFRIFSEFRNLIQRVKPEDNVVIFFSGHGHYDEDFKQGYWIPVDARAGAIGDYIPNSEISTTIRAIPSRHTFMIADACFSGSLFGESRSVFSKQTPSLYHKKVAAIPSRWGLASGRNEIVSDGVAGENSPFSENLLYFLKFNTETPFTVSELVQYVKAATANNAEQTPIGSPLRNVGDKGGEYVFYPLGTEAEVGMEENPEPSIPYTPASQQVNQKDPNAASAEFKTFKAQALRWMKEHAEALVMITFSTLFWGLWSKWLFLVVPAVSLGIMAICEIFRLEGKVKTRTTLVITLIVTIQFMLADRNNLFKGDGFWQSFLERTQNFEFLWFSLGLGCFGAFLYFFLVEKNKS